MKLFATLACAFLCEFIPCSGFAVEAGDTYVLRKGEFVPLFTSSGTNFRYEIGSSGMNCFALDTVLPPGSFVKVTDVCGDVIHVSCKVSEYYSPEGFVQERFFERSMEPLGEALFEETFPKRERLSVEKICEVLGFLVDEKVPFAWGCNNLRALNLRGLYTFKSDDGEKNIPYTCVGLDCSGLLHMVSSWTLPHSTAQLYNLPGGKILCELDADSTETELENALNLMMDTDFVVFSRRYPPRSGGHVIVSLHGGFVEAKGCNFGVVYTTRENALSRLEGMANEGKVRVIRWHPELLN